MDFLKTLMVYLSLTFATSVQGAPTPAPTPVPTPTPATVIMAAATESYDPSVVTPKPGENGQAPEVVTTLTPAPAPTMTANTSYRLLRQGDRGDNVKKLQLRLKELGYLTGEADGAYGGQTRRAVQRFQYYNGLAQDGVAGKNTLTVLYESEHVVAAVTPTPTATSAPAPTDIPENTIAIIMPEETAASAPTEVPPLQTGDTVEHTSPVMEKESKVVVNGSGKILRALVVEDGVQVEKIMRVYTDGDPAPLLDASFMAQCLDNWSWSPDEGVENAYTLLLDGYTLYVTVSMNDAGKIETAKLTIDGEEVALAADDVRVTDEGELLLRVTVFEKAIGASYIWDTEENALIFSYVNKELAGSQD